QRSEERASLLRTRALQSTGEGGIDLEGELGTAVGALRRTRPIGRKLQSREWFPKFVFPVLAGAAADIAIRGREPAQALSKLDWSADLQTNLRAFRRVAFAELPEQIPERPPIADDVVHGDDDQVVLFSRLDHVNPKERPGCEIERGIDFPGEEA